MIGFERILVWLKMADMKVISFTMFSKTEFNLYEFTFVSLLFHLIGSRVVQNENSAFV